MENILHLLKKRAKLIIGLFVVIGLLLGTGIFMRSRTFHIVSTTPSLGKVASQTPYIEVHFNKPLTTDGFSYNSSGNFVTNFEMDKKVLTLYIDNSMQADKIYTIHISSIKNTNGEVIKNKILTFTAQKMEFNELSEDQQNYIVDRDTKKQAVYSVDSLLFEGFDNLTDQGLTNENLDTLKQLFFNYSDKILQTKFESVSLVPDSLVVTLHDPTSTDDTDHASFNVVIDDSTTYKAQIDYSFLTSVVLRLYDVQGNQVFKSDDLH